MVENGRKYRRYTHCPEAVRKYMITLGKQPVTTGCSMLNNVWGTNVVFFVGSLFILRP